MQMMNPNIDTKIDWQPLLDRLQFQGEKHLPYYLGDLKADLLAHAGLNDHAKGETAYQLAVEIARLTTCCDPEIIYWFSRLVDLMKAQPSETECRRVLLVD